ncbi:MAG: hypothetical protein IPJ40_23955 [Saprospirales bacterium]|nr:hypothetical protein [Saprospirales bacterium]
MDDANNCNPVTVEAPGTMCNCTSSAGDMDAGMQSDCGRRRASRGSMTIQEAFDGDDALQFILHTGSRLTIISRWPGMWYRRFCFDAAAGMTYGTTYYISAVVGNDLGGGVVDLMDPCLSIAQGTPVVFHWEPTADLVGDATICVGRARR